MPHKYNAKAHLLAMSASELPVKCSAWLYAVIIVIIIVPSTI